MRLRPDGPTTAPYLETWVDGILPEPHRLRITMVFAVQNLYDPASGHPIMLALGSRSSRGPPHARASGAGIHRLDGVPTLLPPARVASVQSIFLRGCRHSSQTMYGSRSRCEALDKDSKPIAARLRGDPLKQPSFEPPPMPRPEDKQEDSDAEFC